MAIRHLLMLSTLIATTQLCLAGTAGQPVAHQTGFYAGIGATYNFLRNDFNSSGSLHAQSGLPPTGLFTARDQDYHHNRQVLIPQAEAGYFQPLKQSGWLWGLALNYQYTGLATIANAADQNAGTLIPFYNPSVNVLNELQINRIATKLYDQLLLPIFVGKSFDRGFVYGGAGPAWFRVQYTLSPSADTSSGLYAGNLQGFADRDSLWGGVFQAGLAWYLNSDCFVKLNYSYALSEKNNIRFVSHFTPAVNGGLNTGRLALNHDQRLSVQGIGLSINKILV